MCAPVADRDFLPLPARRSLFRVALRVRVVSRIVSLAVYARIPPSAGRGCAKQLWRVCTSPLSLRSVCCVRQFALRNAARSRNSSVPWQAKQIVPVSWLGAGLLIRPFKTSGSRRSRSQLGRGSGQGQSRQNPVVTLQFNRSLFSSSNGPLHVPVFQLSARASDSKPRSSRLVTLGSSRAACLGTRARPASFFHSLNCARP